MTLPRLHRAYHLQVDAAPFRDSYEWRTVFTGDSAAACRAAHGKLRKDVRARDARIIRDIEGVQNGYEIVGYKEAAR